MIKNSLPEHNYGPSIGISEEIHQMKYRSKGESFRAAMTRVANSLKDDEGHFNEFREVLYDMRFMPAGRVQSAMGAPRRVTPYNCFVSMTIPDSMEGIMLAAQEAAKTMQLGGGIGMTSLHYAPVVHSSRALRAALVAL